MNALLVFADGRWMRIADDAVAGQGDAVADALPSSAGETIVAILPGREAIIAHRELPGLSDAQANAAARLAVGELSITPLAALHVAAGPEDHQGERTIVSVDATRMTDCLVTLAAHGLDPAVVLPAPLLLPRPVEGFVTGDIGPETLVRGHGVAFADDPMLTPLLTERAPLVRLDPEEHEAAIIAAVRNPEVNLRTGMFARRRQWQVDPAGLRRIAMLILALGLTILATQIVLILRTNDAAARIEQANIGRAAAILPPGTIVTDPVTQAEARLTAFAGAGGGFLPLAAAVAAAIDATPGSELGAMVFDGEGGLRATVRAGTIADLDAVATKLRATGLSVDAAPVVAGGSRPYRDILMRAR